jgi:hypothetical protein
MKLTKISLFLSSALLLVACDDSQSGSTTQAAKAKSASSSKTNSQKSATVSAKKATAANVVVAPETPAAPAAPEAPQFVEARIVAANPAIITNLDNDPFAGMDAITSETINSHSTYYAYVLDGREYNLARVQLPATEEQDSAKFWAVLVRQGNDFLVANEEQFNHLMDTLSKDESSEGKRFASQLNRHDIKSFDAEAYNQIGSRAGVSTMIPVVADTSVSTEVYNKARLSFPSSENLSTSPAIRFISANGSEYTVVAIKTDKVVESWLPWGVGDYNPSVYGIAKIVKNLFRIEYAPISTAESDALMTELNAAATAEVQNQNTINAKDFLKVLDIRNADLNDSEIRNPAYIITKKITAPAPVVEVSSQN